MKKRIVAFLVMIAMLVASVPAVVATETQLPTIKNIIYMIPDGGGYSPYDFANLVKQAGGFDEAKFPNKTPTNTEPMALRDYLVGSVTTYSASHTVTDSAAAGTALSSGVKTNNNYIGLNSQGKPIANILEAAQSVGKATGLVATYEWMHATPAAFSAHALDRNDYYTLYQQIENKNIDVVLGSGYGNVSNYASIQNAIDRGYTIIDDKAQLNDVEPGDRIWGNMANKNMPYDINLSSKQATLAEMTDAAITALSGDEDGFFLMVEGSMVDSGGHSNNAVTTTSEYLAFDEAFKVAVEFAKKRNDTIVVAVPDHDTGGMKIPEDTNVINSAIAQVQVGTDPSTITWTTTNHTSQNVGVWMYIPDGVSGISGFNTTPGDTATTRSNYVKNNTDIAPYLASFMGVNLTELSNKLFVEVTKVGKYTTGDKKFTFYNSDKYAFANQNYYYKDGQKIDLVNKQMIVVNNRVYVPEDMIEEGDLEQTTEKLEFSGSGTKDDPYLITSEWDFVNFTTAILNGKNYKDAFFRQTADIDLSNNTEYKGISTSKYFSGIYDGQGHTINVDITSDSTACIFPYVDGTIMNLGTTGSITCAGKSYAAGIARSVRVGGNIVNCYSTIDLEGYYIGGLVYTNAGNIVNSYFAGSLSGNNMYAISKTSDSAKYDNCYYLSGCGTTQTESGVTEINEANAFDTLAETLNNGRATAAIIAGVETGKLLMWKQEDDLPTMFAAQSTVTGVTVTPRTATVNKGAGIQLSAVVEGDYNPSQKVHWYIEPESDFSGTYIDEDGYLMIDVEETMNSFTILAKSAQNGSIGGICEITVGSEVVKPEVSVPDGSKENPFLIQDEDDFMQFTTNVIAGETYSGKYFKQTANLDMAGYPGYTGMGKPSMFSGTYDGNGYVINYEINSSTDKCLFPYVDGVIINLGTTGSLGGHQYLGGIARSIRAGGIMANCWSSVDLPGSFLAGLAWSNYGSIVNCYFAGTVSSAHPIAEPQNGHYFLNNYYLGDTYVEADDNTQITSQQLETNLAEWLNDGIADANTLLGYSGNELKEWTVISGQGPRHRLEIVDSVFSAELSEVNVGTTSVSGTIDFENAEECNAYIALFEEESNVLIAFDVVDVSIGDTDKPFELIYEQLSDKNYIIKLFIWDGDFVPLMLPVSHVVE